MLVRAGNIIDALETAFPVTNMKPGAVAAGRLGQPLQTYLWKPPSGGVWELKLGERL